MSEITPEVIQKYWDNLKTANLIQWERINETISSFEINLQRQRERFEEKHLKMLQEIHQESQKVISDFASKSNDLRDLVIGLREQLAYVVSQQNIEEAVNQATKVALKEAKTLINQELWDDKLAQFFKYMDSIANSIAKYHEVMTKFDLKVSCHHPSLFKTATEAQIKFLDTPLEESPFSLRTINCLNKAGIKTVGDIRKKGKDYLLKQRTFGKKSLTEINNLFKEAGISWE